MTANKALLAEHGPEIFAQARESGRSVAFEASVGGGIPIVQALARRPGGEPGPEPLGDPQRHLQLHPLAMTREGLPYASALGGSSGARIRRGRPDARRRRHRHRAQAGDPGPDRVRGDREPSDIPRQGIDRLQSADLKYAASWATPSSCWPWPRLTRVRSNCVWRRRW